MAFLALQDFLGVEFDGKLLYILLISYFLCCARLAFFFSFFFRLFFLRTYLAASSFVRSQSNGNLVVVYGFDRNSYLIHV